MILILNTVLAWQADFCLALKREISEFWIEQNGKERFRNET